MTNHLPPSLVSNLENVLAARRADNDQKEPDLSLPPEEEPPGQAPSSSTAAAEPNPPPPPPQGSKPLVLVTNGDGIGSSGLTLLVDALVRDGLCDVHVCAPDSDKSASGHSVTLRETLAASSVDINGATAFEVLNSNVLTGTPADCVSLALSGALFSWSKPALVVSGINKGSNCVHDIFYSGAIAGAREALMSGVPSLSISLNWSNESQESNFKDAVDVCLPLINAAIRDVETGLFPKSCLLNIEIPTSPLINKGFKVTKQSLRRSMPSWQAVSSTRHAPSGQFMSMHQSLGLQLAQLSRDASAAGAARRLNTQRKNVEIESVAAGKADNQQVVKKYFRLELQEKEQEDLDEDIASKALGNGFIAVTPLHVCLITDPDAQASTADWITSALN
ncbi:putative 5'-nucleotidase [Dioscorea sansibarensis]